jgi:hypothetical protein
MVGETGILLSVAIITRDPAGLNRTLIAPMIEITKLISLWGMGEKSLSGMIRLQVILPNGWRTINERR